MENSDDEKDGVFSNYMPKELSLPNGTKFVDEVLSGQSDHCLENFRMDKQAFYKLCDILHSKGLLRHTNRIKIEEQLAIFLFIIGHNLRTRAVQELFRYSGETISRHFNNVLNAIMAISLDFFQPPGSDIPPEILEDPRFYPYFKDCVGAVDRIHIPVMVGIDEQGPFRNKNGLLSQNVLAACSFDLRFHYVLAGWEGSASDLRVLNSALTRRNKLQVPEEVEHPLMQVENPALDVAFDTEQLEFSSQLRDSISEIYDCHSITCPNKRERESKVGTWIKMLDPTNDILPPPSSPTNSSISSSDLDTESTGSFFHDRSTTLGTLMGVTFTAITFRAPSQHRHPAAASSTVTASANGGNPRRNTKKRRNLAASSVAERRRRRWWSLCRDGGGAKPASLGEFLEVERRFGDAAAELEGVMVAEQPRNGGVNGRLLFADGRVLPPADVVDDGGSSSSTAGALWRFPVSLTGICSGGTG
ncbi:hypothetical protein NC653_029025 [Populus alba x Populus x berolinensis]|nr:hypothetical protein NC653_029025 [Populus alba x Populus x berolinensis]